MGKFSGKLNYAAEAMPIFFIKTKQNLLIPVLCSIFVLSKLNYAAEAMLNLFL